MMGELNEYSVLRTEAGGFVKCYKMYGIARSGITVAAKATEVFVLG